MRYSYVLILLAIFYCPDFYSQIKNEDDLKKQAQTHFEDEDYNLAYKLYAQLVSLYPKDPDYNYKLGVCMLYTEPDKKKPYSYLQIATKNPADAPKDALFYLAKTYHINYRFDDAVKFYTDYKKIGSASSIKKLQVDREIQACINGKRLLSNITDLVVLTKKQLNEADYFKGYDVKDIGGKLLVKPDEYKTAYDKKKKDKSVVYLPKKADRLYYSSYGENGNTGRDIYFMNRLPNGSWSKPTMLPSSINTEFDEDYPFLHPNGKTLYFSSKGFNSMGGYDVFKTTYDESTQTWSKPENLEFPINSPDDDILFVTDSLEKTAFFSTGRYSPYGKLDVLKINTERRPMNFAVVKGTVVKEEAAQSVKSKISVKNMENGEIVGTFNAQDNGDYNLELPNGGKFIFTVETPGIPTQSEAVQIPVAYTLKPYKQVISYDNKILKIINYFDGAVADDNYSMMLDQIEKKAKLEINETEPYNNNLLKDAPKTQPTTDENKNLNSVSTTNPTVQTGEPNTNKNVTNEQLLAIAKTDAKEAGDEAAKLKQEALDAFGLATQKTAESLLKQKEADEALANANTITDVAQKNEELSKANQLKDEARVATNVANTATNMAKKLEVDASVQQKEADLTNQYISQLDAVIKNKNNKQALTKLGEIQKELDDLSKQKNQSSELFTSLKAESELKQQELANSEKKSNSIVNEINSIKNETSNLEKDLANESDKSIKENITAQIRELNNEIDLKNKDLATNQQKIETLKNEVDGVNQEIQIAAKILNESTETIAAATNNTENKSELKTNESQATKVNPLSTEAIATNNTNVTNSNPNTNTNISTDNKEISNPDQLINEAESLSNKASEQRKEASTKNGTEKENLIKQAIENEKMAIDKKLAASEIYEKQNKTKFDNNAVNLTDLQKLSANTSTSESSQANTLINESNLNFKQAQEIRKEAENNSSAAAKLGGLSNAEEKENEAVAKQEKALAILSKTNSTNVAKAVDEPVKSQETIVASNNTSTNNPEALINESENLNTKAYEQRKEAVTKTGTEKDELLKEASANEKLATDKKLEASVLFQKQHNDSFDINATNLNELQKLTGNKTSNEISQANMLTNEAAINFKQAQRIRTEAEAYPNGAARLGGLNNAEEKENEALAKQQKAIAILSKENPTYKLKTVDAIQPTTTVIESDETTKTANIKIDTYLAASKSNQTELNTKKDQLTNNPAFNNSSNTQVQNLKLSADNLNNEAKVFIGQSVTAPTPSEKADLLLKANEKEIAALKALTQASDILNSNAVATNNTNSTTNNESVNPNANRTNETTTSINSNSENSSVTSATTTENSNNSEAGTTTANTTESSNNNPNNSISANSSTTATTDLNAGKQTNNSASTTDENGVRDDASKLKADLNNNNEINLTTFNAYNNTEAISLKEQALQKINAALIADVQIIKALDNVVQMSSTNQPAGTLSQENISGLITEADNLNNEAFAKFSAYKNFFFMTGICFSSSALFANGISFPSR